VPTTNEKWVGTCPLVPYGFGTDGNTYRQNHGGWHHHSPVSPNSPTEDSLTHTTHQSSSSVFTGTSGAPAAMSFCCLCFTLQLCFSNNVCSQTPEEPATRGMDSWLHDTDSHKLEYLAVWSSLDLWALNTIKKFVLYEKVDQSSPKFFTGCYPLRPPIMPNFIKIGQTSLEIRGCLLGLGNFFFIFVTDLTTWVVTRSSARGATKNLCWFAFENFNVYYAHNLVIWLNWFSEKII